MTGVILVVGLTDASESSFVDTTQLILSMMMVIVMIMMMMTTTTMMTMTDQC